MIIGKVNVMRKNQKGQALIEFVIILPVIVLLIFSFIDLGRIVLENNRLEGLTTTVINKYEEVNDYGEVANYIESLGYDDVELSIIKEEDLLTVKLIKKIETITPGLSNVLGNDYSVSVERTVNYEQ